MWCGQESDLCGQTASLCMLLLVQKHCIFASSCNETFCSIRSDVLESPSTLLIRVIDAEILPSQISSSTEFLHFKTLAGVVADLYKNSTNFKILKCIVSISKHNTDFCCWAWCFRCVHDGASMSSTCPVVAQLFRLLEERAFRHRKCQK